MIKSKSSRLLALLLVLLICLSLVPTPTFAFGGGDSGSIISATESYGDGASWSGLFLGYPNYNSIRFSLYFFENAGMGDLARFKELHDKDPDKYYVTDFGNIDVIYNASGSHFNSNGTFHTSAGSKISTVYDYMNNLDDDNESYQKLDWSFVKENFKNNYVREKSYADYCSTITFKNGTVAFNDANNGGFPDIFNDTSLSGNIINKYFTLANTPTDILNFGGGSNQGQNVKNYFNDTAHPERKAAMNNALVIAKACMVQSGMTSISLDEDGLIFGYYFDAMGTKHTGIFQMYIEPIIFVTLEGYNYCAGLSWREAYSAFKGYAGVTTQITKTYTDVSYTWKTWREIKPTIPPVSGMNISYNGSTMRVTGGTVSSARKQGSPETDSDGTKYWLWVCDVVGASGTVNFGGSDTTIENMLAGKAVNQANRLFLTEESGQPILRMTAKQGNYTNSDMYPGYLTPNSNIFKSGGVGVFTSFNAYTDIVANSQPITLVKSYVTPVKSGNTYKYVEAYPSEVETLDNNDIRIEDGDNYYNILQVKLEDSKDGDHIWLNDVVTTAEHYNEIESVNWTGENPTVESSSLKSDLLVGDLRNFLTGNTFLSEQGLTDFYTKLVPNS